MSSSALHDGTRSSPHAYEPPTIVRLGTLAELTQGGTTGIDDLLGGGGSGDVGSLG